MQIAGKDWTWHIVSFKQALLYLCEAAPAFRRLLRETWLQHPCRQSEPWSLILYGDEIVPGAVLRPDNHRKLFAWYCTIKELGPLRIKHEILWVPLAVLRSDVFKGEVGAVSVATAILFQETLFA